MYNIYIQKKSMCIFIHRKTSRRIPLYGQFGVYRWGMKIWGLLFSPIWHKSIYYIFVIQNFLNKITTSRANTYFILLFKMLWNSTLKDRKAQHSDDQIKFLEIPFSHMSLKSKSQFYKKISYQSRKFLLPAWGLIWKVNEKSKSHYCAQTYPQTTGKLLTLNLLLSQNFLLRCFHFPLAKYQIRWSITHRGQKPKRNRYF